MNPQTSERTFIVGPKSALPINYDGKNGIVLREVEDNEAVGLTDR
ncbi:hypothetical protein SPFM1_00227 [Salmonella phage SPFM1]|nr:hypothetical protein SPFM1_00227 [Salmonella phage SPFM1]